VTVIYSEGDGAAISYGERMIELDRDIHIRGKEPWK